MPIIGFVLIQLVVFGILVYLLKSQWTQSLERATSHVAELETDLARKTEEAQKKLAEANKHYDDAVQKARADSEKSKVEILREAQENSEKIIDESRAKSRGILEEAKKAREQLLAEVDARIAAAAVEKASGWIAKLIPSALAAQVHDGMFDEFVKNEFTQLKRLHFPEDVSEAAVSTPFPLSGAQKKLLSERLTSLSGRKIELKEESDPALIAGIRITLGSLVLDSSLQFKVRQLTAEGRDLDGA